MKYRTAILVEGGKLADTLNLFSADADTVFYSIFSPPHGRQFSRIIIACHIESPNGSIEETAVRAEAIENLRCRLIPNGEWIDRRLDR